VTVIRAADLFAGAGGASTGLAQACAAAGASLDLTAVNHWPIAVETHASNHPDARHVCESLDTADPRKLIRGRLDVLWASPECTHHSRARGGKPISDQSRATAWCVVRWADALRPRWIGVENVAEFEEWAPLGSNGKPLKSRKGEVFRAWVNALTALGYTVEVRRLCAADYGAYTTRTRLFVLCRFDGGRSRGPIAWPEATHAPRGATRDLFGERDPWRPARDVIDWSVASESIFRRRRALKPKTIERIADGFRRQGPAAEPFLLMLTHGGRSYSLDAPLPTITCANRGELGLVEPFVLGQQSGAVARPVSRPLPTMATGCAVSLVEPFLVPYYGACEGADSIHDPLRTLTTKDRLGLVQPMIADILFRMLQPHECAAGMGFPRDYQFAGNRGEVMRQVGNAVEVNNARALASVMVDALLGRDRRAA
jgi:DNA (cytosine-5)-methyltransferase 1